MNRLGDYTVALLIGRALHLAAAPTPTSAAVRELVELAEGRPHTLALARHHYTQLVSEGTDLESSCALHLLGLALRVTAVPAPADLREVRVGAAAR